METLMVCFDLEKIIGRVSIRRTIDGTWRINIHSRKILAWITGVVCPLAHFLKIDYPETVCVCLHASDGPFFYFIVKLTNIVDGVSTGNFGATTLLHVKHSCPPSNHMCLLYFNYSITPWLSMVQGIVDAKTSLKEFCSYDVSDVHEASLLLARPCTHWPHVQGYLWETSPDCLQVYKAPGVSHPLVFLNCAPHRCVRW